ncbi:MAG: ABC transporter ATP-binding protein [Acidimicrobiales bacterium]
MSERPAPTEQALLDHASPDQGGPVVEATAVSKEFPRGNVLAIDSMSFAMGEHTFTSVVGPSGCGKSTILRLVAGLIPISSGDLRVRGSAVSGPRADTSMMFQRPVLLLWKTAMDNVLLPEKLQGRVTAATRRRAGEIFELVGLAGFENAYPQHLSGGMQQRAALARVLMTGADLLLMDEPFASLDEFTRERLNLELLRIQAEFRASVMFVTHNITEAVFLADRVLVMTPRPGRLAGIVEVPFDRPRRIDLLKTPEFNELAFQVRAMLGEHV